MTKAVLGSTLAATALGAALLLGACGDDDDSTTVNTPVGDITVDGSDVDPGDIDDIIDEDGNLDLDGALDGLSIDTKIGAMEAGLSAAGVEVSDYEIVDDSNARVFIDADTGSESSVECIVAGSILAEGQSVVYVYNDGTEVTCAG